MKNRSVRKSLTATCLLVTSLSAAPAFAAWYINQDEGYYKPQEYRKSSLKPIMLRSLPPVLNQYLAVISKF